MGIKLNIERTYFLASVGEQFRQKPNQVDDADDYRDESSLVRVQQAERSHLANHSCSYDFPEVRTKTSEVENSKLRKELQERSQQRTTKERVKKCKYKETGIITNPKGTCFHLSELAGQTDQFTGK